NDALQRVGSELPVTTGEAASQHFVHVRQEPVRRRVVFDHGCCGYLDPGALVAASISASRQQPFTASAPLTIP
ncbi:MAG: hypothetical protein KDD66_09330, partial [Bdellovibrionales bacterium]|nr:hypothetical protein [Bdellovibrionales bacterium]